MEFPCRNANKSEGCSLLPKQIQDELLGFTSTLSGLLVKLVDAETGDDVGRLIRKF